jgi:hypothetical protein
VEGSRRPIEMVEGSGETLRDALEDAAARAVEKNVANVGKEYVVLQHTVTVSNPRISEHKVVLGASE